MTMEIYYTHRISVILTVKNIIRIETYTIATLNIYIGNNNNITYYCYYSVQAIVGVGFEEEGREYRAS